MAKGKTNYPGGGVNTSDATAVAGDIVAPETAYIADGSKATGTITEKVGSATVITPSAIDQTIPEGRYGGAAGDGKVLGDADLVAANIKDTVNIFGVVGTYDHEAANPIAAGSVLSGKVGFVNGVKVTGTISSKGTQTYTPGTSNQTISAGQYLSGDQTISGDGDLVAGNIKHGVDIFGVTGTYDTEASAPIAAATVLTGKVGFVNGTKITGTMTNVGAQSITPTAAGVAITAGYHNGSGATVADADFVAGNIKKDVVIWGVTGTMEGADLSSELYVSDGSAKIYYYKVGKIYIFHWFFIPNTYRSLRSEANTKARIASLFGVTVSSWLEAAAQGAYLRGLYYWTGSGWISADTYDLLIGFVAA